MALTKDKISKLKRTPIGESGNRLAKAMELAELTQQQVADAVALSQPYVSDVVRGRHSTITVDNAQRFADLFGCIIEDLFPPKEREAVAS